MRLVDKEYSVPGLHVLDSRFLAHGLKVGKKITLEELISLAGCSSTCGVARFYMAN